MNEIIQSRRSFVRGLGSLFVAAPAIVRASSLMQIRGEKLINIADLSKADYTALYMSEEAPVKFSGFWTGPSIAGTDTSLCFLLPIVTIVGDNA